MYKFSWTVRTYYALMRAHYPTITTQAEAVAAAETLSGKSGVGYKVLTELYRAGGLGAHNIHARFGYVKPFESVKAWCEHCDMGLHDSLD